MKITDFLFQFAGYGYYRITYISPKTNKTWVIVTNNTRLIDCTFHMGSYAKKKDLNDLKKLCKK